GRSARTSFLRSSGSALPSWPSRLFAEKVNASARTSRVFPRRLAAPPRYSMPACSASADAAWRRSPSVAPREAVSSRAAPVASAVWEAAASRRRIAPALDVTAPAASAAAIQVWLSSQQNVQRDVEVNDQPRHVHERGDERRRRARGIEAQASENERQHRADERAEHHDAHERDGDGEREWIMHDVHDGHAVGERDVVVVTKLESEHRPAVLRHVLPRLDAREADDRQDHAEREPRRDLAARDTPPVAKRHFAERERPDEQRRALRARVAA